MSIQKQESWNPEFLEKENPSNLIPKIGDPSAMPSDPDSKEGNQNIEEEDDQWDGEENEEDIDANQADKGKDNSNEKLVNKEDNGFYQDLE